MKKAEMVEKIEQLEAGTEELLALIKNYLAKAVDSQMEVARLYKEHQRNAIPLRMYLAGRALALADHDGSQDDVAKKALALADAIISAHERG